MHAQQDIDRLRTVVVGGGPAGLATSHGLAAAGVPHVVLERGRLAERWRNERWDSLRLLTPNWMTRLPGRPYDGPDPDGHLTAAEVADHLVAYADSFAAPVREHAPVTRVSRADRGFHVATSTTSYLADQVVIATGATGAPAVPRLARRLDPRIQQLHARDYKRPSQLPAGAILVVGAAASGVQLADELARAGRDVTLAVGRHTRLPRTWRGRDVHRWLDDTGVLDRPTDSMPDLAAARREPSLQLVGRETHEDLDLATLAASGVRLCGRLVQADGTTVGFADDLADHVAAAEARLTGLLDRFDAHSAAADLPAAGPRPRPVDVRGGPTELDLTAEGVTTVLWATGYRRSFPWLDVPDVLDARGEVRHRDGATAVPGLHVLGMPFTRRRNSTFLGGIGTDAGLLAGELVDELVDGPGRHLTA